MYIVAQVWVRRAVRGQQGPVDQLADWTDNDLERYIATGERPAIRPN